MLEPTVRYFRMLELFVPYFSQWLEIEFTVYYFRMLDKFLKLLVRYFSG